MSPVPKGINYTFHLGNIPGAGRQPKWIVVCSPIITFSTGGERVCSKLCRRCGGEGLAAAGAGTDLEEAEKPVEIALAGGSRLRVWPWVDTQRHSA